MDTYTAHDIAAEPDLYSKSVTFGNSKFEWECMGYSDIGETIRFARLATIERMQVRQVNKYVSPSVIVNIA